jgi:hypothetical protein
MSKYFSDGHEYIDTVHVDKRTGAEYKVKERVPNGPQGDFRIPENQAENRYRMIMGLPSNGSFHERPIEDPFVDERLQPETLLDASALEAKVRLRAFDDTRREQAFMPSREMAPWASRQDFEDHEDHTVDPNGRIRDKAKGTVGPFGTEDVRQKAPPSKLTREAVAKPVTNSAYNVVPKAPLQPDALEKRVSEKAGLQVLLTNVFRGLFGNNVSNHIMNKSDLSDRRLGTDQPVVAHAIMDAGLMKPWQPPVSKTDRPQKQENLEYAVGNRAISQLISQRHASAPDIQDLPKAERDDLTTAIGRTILNAMTSLPSKATEKPLFESKSELKMHEELYKSIASAIKPEILKGLVAPELLSDRRPVDMQQSHRVHGSSRTTGLAEMPDRSSDAADGRFAERAPERAPFTRTNVGDFAQFGFERKVRTKKMFEEAESHDAAGRTDGAAGQTNGPNGNHTRRSDVVQQQSAVAAQPKGSYRPSAFSSRTEIAEQDRVFFSQAMNF